MNAVICNACGRACGAYRDPDRGEGACSMPLIPLAARAALHFGEEPCISGTKGSGTVFFSGCSLGCRFCQNYAISGNGFGYDVTPERLTEIYRELEHKGAHNINLVNPTHFIKAIAESFSGYRPSIPVVYNTSGYDSVQTIREAGEFTDVFLPDLKLFDPARCKRYLNAENYFSTVSAAVAEMLKLRPENRFSDGLLQSGVIIRHLVLPCNLDQTRKVLDYIKQNYGNVTVSLMTQYFPSGLVSDRYLKEINRVLTPLEKRRARDYFISLDFENGYVQEDGCENSAMVPVFDGEGIIGQ